MAKIIDSVRLPFTGFVGATGTGTITSNRVERGQMLVAQSIAFRNETGARGTATLQIRQGNVVTRLADQASPVANQWYHYPYEQHINEGEQVEVSQASCVAADVLRLEIVGYIVYKSEVERR